MEHWHLLDSRPLWLKTSIVRKGLGMSSVASAQNDPPAPESEVSPPLASPTRFLGRQPILDEKCRLFAYELLFRSGPHDFFSGDPEEATREVIDHILLLIPEHEEALAFVNCTRQALTDGIATLLPAENTVLEILENIDPDPELLASCSGLRKLGYHFALDDFAPDRARAPLIEFADFIKVDFRSSDAAARREIYAMARGTGVRLIAEKVETEEEMRLARSEGCSLFQGYFFSRPLLVASRAVPQNQLVYLSLLAVLNEIPANIRELERLVLSDASLCYRILRLANSALHGHPGIVTTVRAALIMIGDDAVRRMVTVALAGALASHHSPALISMALARARFCELLAPALGQPPQQLYLLGILSLLDVLLAIPMGRILKTLPLSAEMKSALLGADSPIAPALDLVRSLESCDWERCEILRRTLDLEESSVAALYVDSLHWASSMTRPPLHPGASQPRASL